MHSNSKSESYAAAGVDITAGYKAVELMKKHIARTAVPGVMGQVGGWMSRQHDGAVLQQLFLSDSELILRMSW